MDQTQLSDILAKSRQGDPQAQEALVIAAQDRVYYHCKKRPTFSWKNFFNNF